ncbi:MAG: NADH-quinone oxidoreductase subunit M [Pseudobdellovibrionaceae bacterium]|jgi:NADH-quinone oxidoreductase subunit M|nr:NADH-quinone oxidoreductase subunit M [Pseudobdellovibrionaceae bacterium]
MTEFPILSLMTFLPLIGAALMLLMKGQGESVLFRSKMVALLVSGLTFILSLVMLLNFDPASTDYQFEEKKIWFESIGISYHMGVDGISLFFVVLSAFLTPICVLASWNSVSLRVKEYLAAFLLLETFMIGTFCALDAILFYLFFEGVLIPMFIIIGVWGGPRRVYSAFKFFLYTLLGSVLMLVALLTMIVQAGTADIPTLMGTDFAPELQTWLWLAFFASFAVKMPMWPVHTWLPDAHVEAPTAGSVILAGVLLKMGGYGFLRFSLPMLPDATEFFAPMVFGLSVIAIIYTSLIALIQTDMKKMIAYSSVAHMGFVTLGIFTLNMQGIQGAVFQMISHGVVSAALFLAIGVVYDRLHTRDIGRYGNLSKNMPIYATVFVILMLGAVGLPGTSGFVGEFLALLGVFKVDTTVATLAASGVVLGAAYMLHLTRKLVFGPKVNEDAAEMSDLTTVEKAYFLPLVVLVLWLGIAPGYVLERTVPAIESVLSRYEVQVETIPAAVPDEGQAEGQIIVEDPAPQSHDSEGEE